MQPLPDGNPRDEIARLEAEIEERAAALERCRKVILLGKIAAAAGAIVLVLLFVGVVRMEPAVMITAMAAVIGGIVAFGSTTTTANQLFDAIQAAEARRAELIGMLELEVVADAPERRTLH
jgi:hypothetical protein